MLLVLFATLTGTEHERIISSITPDTVLYDVFAGVGPFAVPAAKKLATVYCNDLNPHSYKFLSRNLIANKVKGKQMQPKFYDIVNLTL